MTQSKFSVVTTFNADGYNRYGQRMIETFLQNWPQEVELIVYTEDCTVRESAPNLVLRDLAILSDLAAFKQKWQNVPKATGDISSDPVRSLRKDAGKGFKWNAIKFAHNTYSIFHCAQMQLGTKGIKRFLREFQRMYDDAENGIFLLDEWHDSFVFDAVRKNIPGLIEFNWAAKLGDLRPSKLNSPGEGHPLINSDWGAYLDHLKGARKDLKRSKREDLKVIRTEAYWQ